MTEARTADLAAETIMIPAPRVEIERPSMLNVEDHEAWPVVSRLSIPVGVEIGFGRFKVRDLLSLEVGKLIESSWPESGDIMVSAGGIQIGWSEFEVEDQRLMARVTRLA